MTITIFTPTYNRAHLLRAAYKSLCEQTCKDFEWLVVDDGSVDNTEEVINGFVQEGSIDVRYVKKENGGKHTAINVGAKVAKGNLFWILDSDDSLPKDAVEKVLQYYSEIKGRKDVGGICGYMAHHNGEVIGRPLIDKPLLASSLEMRYELGIKGDMMEVFRTSVMREMPFPEFEGEKFCPEVLVWNRIATKYKLLVVPNVMCYRDYIDGGLTDNIVSIRMKSPVASMMTYKELFETSFPLLIKEKIKAAINYWRFAFCARERVVSITSWGNIFMPIGYLMHLMDKRKVK